MSNCNDDLNDVDTHVPHCAYDNTSYFQILVRTTLYLVEKSTIRTPIS